MRNLTALVAAAGIVFALTAVPAQADQAAALKAMAKSKIITWAQDPKVVAAIKAQNTLHLTKYPSLNLINNGVLKLLRLVSQ
jgi:hypothetical protein